ncbi:MAG: two-component regulator propeller domain-containing protein [Bacteroidota bacterium]
MKKHALFFYAVIIHFFLPLSSHSNNEWIFDHLTIDNGLPHNTINDILRDRNGFLWFATNDGLARYDGYDFTIYRHIRENKNSLTNNKVYTLFEDSKGTLWIGTSSGLNKYNSDLDNFTRYYHDPDNYNSLSNNAVRVIYEDKKGYLWLGTLNGGLNKLDVENHKFTRYNFPNRTVSSVLEDSEGNLWVGTNDPGITLLNRQSNDFDFFAFPPSSYHKGLRESTLKTIVEDEKGNLWVCTEGAGLYLFDKNTKSFTDHFYRSGDSRGLKSNIVNDIFIDQKQKIWLATDGGGINILDTKTSSIEYVQNNIADTRSLSSNAVYKIYNDAEGIIWIGTFAGGVNILNPHLKEFQLFIQRPWQKKSLSHKSVLSFYEDHKKNVWVGTDGGGLNLFNRDQNTFRVYKNEPGNPYSLSSNVVTSMAQDDKGYLWIGTFAGGLNRFDLSTGRFKRYNYDANDSLSLGSNNVWKLLLDKDKTLWVGTLDQLSFYDEKQDAFIKIPKIERTGNLFPGRILALYEDSKGNIWVGSNGLGILDKETLSFTFLDEMIDNTDQLQEYDIRDFHEDRSGNIWIATEGAGIFKYSSRNNQLVNFTTKNGLPSDAIHQIIEDQQGFFWMSTNKGIAKFNPRNGDINNYDAYDGLQSNQFAYSASLLSSGGKIYFGGVNGFNVFDPQNIKVNQKPPDVHLTGFSLFNKPVEIGKKDSPLDKHISQTKEISLPYGSVFSLRFTAINYISTPKNRYKYKLEGFDDWNDVGNQRIATYTNIDPGKYTFKVIAANNDGYWNKEGAEVVINILPPFWRTWVAYVIYFLLGASLLYFIMSFVVNRQKYKHDLMIKDLEKAKIEEINQEKLMFFTNIAHEFRTPLTLILGPLDKLMASYNNAEPSIKKQLSIMGRNAGRLLRLINELMEFRKIEMGKVKLKIVEADMVAFLKDVKSVFDEHARLHDIQFNFNTEKESVFTWFDKEKMEKVFYNILSNAFKFTADCGTVTIDVKIHKPGKKQKKRPFAKIANIEEKETMEIIISDNGIGISEEDLPKIFDRFYQVKNKNNTPRSHSILGTGIGLALSKELVDFHKGEIKVSSKAGKGTVFRILLPLGKEHLEQNIIVEQTSDDYVYQYTPGIFGIPHAELNQHAEPSSCIKNPGEKPILLFIDDNPDMRSYIRSSLEDKYVIHEAENGLHGLKAAKSIMPDIIVSDVMMPEMDGLQLCKKLKEDVNTSHVPVVLLTAKISDDYTIEGFDAGADDYIPKPFNPKVLHSRIKNILEIRQNLRDKFKKEELLEPGEVSVTSADELFLKKAMEVVEKNIGNSEFRVSNFVAEMNMSRSVLYRKFEALTGQSVNEFVRNTRLKRAAQLLSTNELTVSEVTYEVGFSDPQYFSKCFSKYHGVTPSEYAKRKARQELS